MNYDSAILVVYRWFMLFLVAAMLTLAGALTIWSLHMWPVSYRVSGAHFGMTNLQQRTCSEIAEDTRRNLLDSGASAARANEKSDRAYDICIIGRENAEPATTKAASAADRSDGVDGPLPGD